MDRSIRLSSNSKARAALVLFLLIMFLFSLLSCQGETKQIATAGLPEQREIELALKAEPKHLNTDITRKTRHADDVILILDDECDESTYS